MDIVLALILYIIKDRMEEAIPFPDNLLLLPYLETNSFPFNLNPNLYNGFNPCKSNLLLLSMF
jgi:hypothetical protein